LEDELDIVGVFAPFCQDLERMFLRRQESLVVPPPLNQSKSPRLPRGMGQSVDDILACGFLCDPTDNPLDAFDPDLQLHVDDDDREDHQEWRSSRPLCSGCVLPVSLLQASLPPPSPHTFH